MGESIFLCANDKILIMFQTRPSGAMGPLGILLPETAGH